MVIKIRSLRNLCYVSLVWFKIARRIYRRHEITATSVELHCTSLHWIYR